MDLVRIAARVASPRKGVNWALVTRWAEGPDPSQYGWTISGVRFSAQDVIGATEEELAALGVPDEFVQRALASGYSAGELDVFLSDNAQFIGEE